MTKSQIVAAIAGAAVVVNELASKLDLLTAILPAKYAGWLRVAVTVAGVVLVAFSQSLNMNHISVPVERITPSTAEKLGVSDQVEGKG
jgi:hypothetical protein